MSTTNGAKSHLVIDDYPAAAESELDKLYPTGGFKSLGHLLWAVSHAGRHGDSDRTAVAELKRWNDALVKMRFKSPLGNSEQTDPDGGALVPVQLAQEIYDRTLEQNQILSLLDPVITTRRTYALPALKEDSRKDGYRHGGVTGYWEDEGDQHTYTSPTFRKIVSRLFKLSVEVPVTDELLEDSPIAIETFLRDLVASEINFKINDAVINGYGVKSPLGILNSPSRITVDAVSGQGAKTIIAQNILDMLERVNTAQKQRMVWLYSHTAESQILRFYTATGEFAATMLVQFVDGQLQIAGRPAYLMEQCQELGSEGDLIAFAPDGYLAVIQGTMSSSVSIHVLFDYDQSLFKFRFRINGSPKDLTPVTPYFGTTTTSAIVTLNATRT